MTRQAISPRLAIRILSNMSPRTLQDASDRGLCVFR
jgi:hypothetical protein